MLKEHNVVMLPTGKASKLRFHKNKLIFHTQAWEEDKFGKPQHLYIFSNEEIKDDKEIDDNTCIFKSSNDLIICLAGKGYGRVKTPGSYYRITASTDRTILEYKGNDIRGKQYDAQFQLPNISINFIEAYIKAYNEGNIITKIQLEYEIISCDGNLNYSHNDHENCHPDNADEVYICDKCGVERRNPGFNYGKQRTCYEQKKQLKLKETGEVIIHPIKERMFTESQAKVIYQAGMNKADLSSRGWKRDANEYSFNNVIKQFE